MKRDALVVNVKGRLMAEIRRSEACGDCHACDMGRSEAHHYPLPKGDYREGDIVTLEISDRLLPRATLIAYGLPLAFLLAGLVIGFLAFEAEWAQALTALVFLAIGCIIIKLTEKKRRAAGKFVCRASKNIEF